MSFELKNNLKRYMLKFELIKIEKINRLKKVRLN